MDGRDQQDAHSQDEHGDQDAEPPMTAPGQRRPDGTSEDTGEERLHSTEPAEGRDDV